MPLTVESHHRPEVFDALADEWALLLRRSASDTLFLTPDYQRIWWRHLGQGQLSVLTVREAGPGPESPLLGVAPLFATERPGQGVVLQTVGCVEVSDYLDWIAAPGREEEVLEAILYFLAGTDGPGWDRLELCSIPQHSPTLRLLPVVAGRLGWAVQVQVQAVCPVVWLPSTWEEYLSILDRKDRHELRRKLRRAEANQGLNWYIVGAQHPLEDEVEAFLDLMAKSSRQKAAFLTEPMRAFFRELAQVAWHHGWLQLAFLQWGGHRLAGYFNFVYRNRVLVYNSGLDWRADPGLGAGVVLTAFLIRHAIAEGREAYDFLRGSEDYKYRFGGKDVGVHRIVVTPWVE